VFSGYLLVEFRGYSAGVSCTLSRTAGPSTSLGMTRKARGVLWYPTQAKPGLTPISCHAVLERSACAPFIKERRMQCINATSLRRKSGQWGTQPSVPVQAGHPSPNSPQRVDCS
jgi:hypothetical protein